MDRRAVRRGRMTRRQGGRLGVRNILFAHRAILGLLAFVSVLATVLGLVEVAQAAEGDNILIGSGLTVTGRWGNSSSSTITTKLNNGNLTDWWDNYGNADGVEDAFYEMSWNQPVWINAFKLYSGRGGGYESRLDGGQVYIYNGSTLVASIVDPTPTADQTDNELIRVNAGYVNMSLTSAVQATSFRYVGQRENRDISNCSEIQIFEAAPHGIWIGTTDALWATATNWADSVVPGSGQTATFNNAGNGNTTLDLGGGVTINTVLFDGNAIASYTIGSGTVNSQTLTLNNGGAVTMSAATGSNQLVNAALTLGTDNTVSTYTLTNNSTAKTFTFAGNITGNNDSGTPGIKTLAIAGAGATSIGGIIADGGATNVALTKSGTGVLTLSASNTYTGTTTVSGGLLRAADGIGLSADSTLVLSGGVLETSGNFLRPASTDPKALQILTGNSGFSARGGALTIDLDGDGTGTGLPVTWGNAAFQPTVLVLNTATADSALDFKNAIDLKNGSTAVTRTIQVNANTATLSGILGNTNTANGGAGLTKTGTGTLTLKAANTYSGTTTVSAGTLAYGCNDALGTGAITVNGTGAVLALGGYSDSVGLVTLTAGDITGTGGTLTSTSGFTMNNAGAASVSAVLAGSVGLAKSAAGILTLNAANTYSGLTNITGGTLAYGCNDALGTGAVTVNGTGAVLALGGYSDSVGLVTLTAGDITGAGTLTSTGGFTMNNTNATSVSAGLAGEVGLTKSGAGVLTLSGANTYTGATTISAGTIKFLKAASLYNDNSENWTAANIIVNSAATLTLNVGGTDEFTTGDVATIAALGSGTDGLKSGAILALDTTNAAGGEFIHDTAVANPNSGANTLNLTKLGTNTLTLGPANSYSGVTTIKGGVLKVSSLANGGSNSSIGRADYAAANLILDGSTLQYTGSGATGGTTDRLFTLGTGTMAGTLDASGAAGSPMVFNNTGTMAFTGTGVRTLTLTGTNTDANTLAAVIGNQSTNATSLTKSGSSKWVIGGTSENTYTGATLVSGGTLAYGANDAIGTGAVTVNGTGAVLAMGGFSDSVGAVTLTAGDITASGGTLTSTGNFTMNNAAASSVSAVLAGSGKLIKSSGGVLTLSGANSYSGVTAIGAGVLEVTTLANGGSPSGIGQASSAAANLVFASKTYGGNGGTLRYIGSGATNGTTDRLFTMHEEVGNIDNLAPTPTLDASGAAGSPMVFTNTGRLVDGYSQNGNIVTLTLTGSNTDDNTLASVITQQRRSDRYTKVVKSGPGTWVLTGANIYDNTTTISDGVLKVTRLGAVAPVQKSNMTTTAGSPIVTVDSTAGLVPGMIIDWASLIPNGSVIDSIDSATQFTLTSGSGVTAGMNASGTIGYPDSLGWSASTAANLVLNGGTLQYVGSGASTGTTHRLFTLGLGVTAGALNASGASGSPFVLSNTGSMATTGTGTRTLTLTGTNTDDNTLAAVIVNQGTNSTSLVKAGTGKWILSGANTHSGTTTVSDGVLQLNNSLALQNSALDVSSPGSVVVSSGLTSLTLGGLIGTWDLTLPETVTALTLKPAAGVVNTYSGNLLSSSAMTLTINGASTGTQILAAEYAYEGTTTITASTLRLGAGSSGANSPLGAAMAGTSVAGGAALDLNGFSINSNEALSLNGTGISSGGALTNSSATAATFAGPITLAGAASIIAGSGDIDLTNTTPITGPTFGLTLGGSGADSSLAAPITTTSGTLTKAGAGKWTLTGASTYTGGTTISGGTLALRGGNDRLPAGKALSFGGNGTLDLGSNSQSISAFTVNGGITATVTGSGGSLSAPSLGLGTTNSAGTLIVDGGLTVNLSGDVNVGTGGTSAFGTLDVRTGSIVNVTGKLYAGLVGGGGGAFLVDGDSQINVSGSTSLDLEYGTYSMDLANTPTNGRISVPSTSDLLMASNNKGHIATLNLDHDSTGLTMRNLSLASPPYTSGPNRGTLAIDNATVTFTGTASLANGGGGQTQATLTLTNGTRLNINGDLSAGAAVNGTSQANFNIDSTSQLNLGGNLNVYDGAYTLKLANTPTDGKISVLSNKALALGHWNKNATVSLSLDSASNGLVMTSLSSAPQYSSSGSPNITTLNIDTAAVSFTTSGTFQGGSNKVTINLTNGATLGFGTTLDVRNNAGSSAVIQGTGTLNVGTTFTNNGRVVADGGDLMVNATTIAQNETVGIAQNDGTKAGWYATNGGKLTLKTLSINGNASYNWGEAAADTTLDLVNSLNLSTWSGADLTGSLAVSLLAANNATVLPGLVDPVGIWNFTPTDLTVDSVALKFRYDDVAAGANEATLKLYHNSGTGWQEVTSGFARDTTNNWISGTVSGFSQFAVAQNAVPPLWTWQGDVPGSETSWGEAGNWDVDSIPSASGIEVVFGAAGSYPTVALGGERAVGTLTFLSDVPTKITGSLEDEHLLTLSGPSGATIEVDAGADHEIAAPLVLASDLAVSINGTDDTLTLSGPIESLGDHGIAKAGPGTLALTGDNIYSGGTTVTAGTLAIGSAGALPAGRSLSIGSGGTLILGGGRAMGTSAQSAEPVPEPVPEPGTLALLAIAALAGVMIWRRRR